MSKENKKKKQAEKREKEIKEWKNRIHEYRHEAATLFNKQIVFLSSGGLILTIGFVKDIVEIDKAICCCLLVLTWLLLIASLFLNLISHKSTIKAMDLELNDLCVESDNQDVITSRYDRASIITFVTAIVMFIIFVSLNIL